MHGQNHKQVWALQECPSHGADIQSWNSIDALGSFMISTTNFLGAQNRAISLPWGALWIAPTFLAAPRGNWTSAPSSFMVKSTVLLMLVKEGHSSTTSYEMKANAPPSPERKSTQRDWNRAVATQFGTRFPFHKPPNHPHEQFCAHDPSWQTNYWW